MSIHLQEHHRHPGGAPGYVKQSGNRGEHTGGFFVIGLIVTALVLPIVLAFLLFNTNKLGWLAPSMAACAVVAGLIVVILMRVAAKQPGLDARIARTYRQTAGWSIIRSLVIGVAMLVVGLIVSTICFGGGVQWVNGPASFWLGIIGEASFIALMASILFRWQRRIRTIVAQIILVAASQLFILSFAGLKAYESLGVVSGQY